MGVSFNPSIDLGHILEAAIFILAAMGSYFALKNDVKLLKSDMASVKIEMAKMTEVLVELARVDEKINSVMNRVERLEEKDDYGPSQN